MSDWMQRWELLKTEAKPLHPYIRFDDLVHSTHISLKHNYFYAETPKVACSTIKKLLIQAEYGEQVEHENFEFVHFREFSPLLNLRQIGSLPAFFDREDIFKFCFVRNPYTRLLSAYLDKIQHNKPQKNPILIQLGYGEDADKALSFAEFVDAVVALPPVYMDQHWRIQYYQTYQQGISYNFIGRFENFESDFRSIIAQIGIDFDAFYQVLRPHVTGADEKTKTYYTPELQDKVYRKYQIDFEAFGYSKEIP